MYDSIIYSTLSVKQDSNLGPKQDAETPHFNEQHKYDATHPCTTTQIRPTHRCDPHKHNLKLQKLLT